jgi:integrative and conjugative element protein (TIGR02256 family)
VSNLLLKELTIDIAPDAHERILDLAKLAADGRETGGILLGRGPKNDVIAVEVAGDPGPNAKRQPDFFLRDLEHARSLAAIHWKESRAVWVGEWHTHLNGDPRPSPTDLATYAGHLQAGALDFEAFVSVIVLPGPNDSWADARLFPWVLSVTDSLGK